MSEGIEFRAVVLDASHGDQDAMLAFRNGRLVAVLSCLGAMHNDLAGHWYVEILFADPTFDPRETFATLDEAAAWLKTTSSDRTTSSDGTPADR